MTTIPAFKLTDPVFTLHVGLDASGNVVPVNDPTNIYVAPATGASATAAKQDTQTTALNLLHTDNLSIFTKLDLLHTDNVTTGVIRGAQAVMVSGFTIASAASLSNGVNMNSRSALRLDVPAGWTAANITVQVSSDNVTYYDLYDEYGVVYTIQAAASRSIFIAPGPLLNAIWVKLRSGTPATPVVQVSAVTLSLSSAAL